MLIPYSTDAPLYHLPIATVALLVVNVVAFVPVATLGAADFEQHIVPWMLSHGDGLHPLQWIASNFIHGGVLHLLGNMFSLWAFGLVVEGKIGWWRFLLAYFGIGFVQCALEQTIALGASGGGSFGASATRPRRPESGGTCFRLATSRAGRGPTRGGAAGIRRRGLVSVWNCLKSLPGLAENCLVR